MDKKLLTALLGLVSGGMNKLVPTANAASAQLTPPQNYPFGIQGENVKFRGNGEFSSKPDANVDWEKTYYTLPNQSLSAITPQIQQDLASNYPNQHNEIGAAGGGGVGTPAQHAQWEQEFYNWYNKFFQ